MKRIEKFIIDKKDIGKEVYFHCMGCTQKNPETNHCSRDCRHEAECLDKWLGSDVPGCECSLARQFRGILPLQVYIQLKNAAGWRMEENADNFGFDALNALDRLMECNPYGFALAGKKYWKAVMNGISTGDWGDKALRTELAVGLHPYDFKHAEALLGKQIFYRDDADNPRAEMIWRVSLIESSGVTQVNNIPNIWYLRAGATFANGGGFFGSREKLTEAVE